MLISYILLLLSSNAATLKRDKSILYSMVSMKKKKLSVNP